MLDWEMVCGTKDTRSLDCFNREAELQVAAIEGVYVVC
jgi:hypothetical protein